MCILRALSKVRGQNLKKGFFSAGGGFPRKRKLLINELFPNERQKYKVCDAGGNQKRVYDFVHVVTTHDYFTTPVCVRA